MLDELVKNLEEGETSGPDVNQKLASIVNKRFRAPLSLDKLKQKQEKYSRPSNCESLDVPQLNKEVKDIICIRTVACDKQFQYIQMAIVKASSALAITADKLLDPSYKIDNEALLTTIIDALALLSHGHSQLGSRWRNAVVPDLNKTYEGLVSSDIPFTKQLFGDGVLKTLAELKRAKEAKYGTKQYAPKTTEAPGTGAIKNNNSSRENNLGHIHTGNSARIVPPNKQVALFSYLQCIV